MIWWQVYKCTSHGNHFSIFTLTVLIVIMAGYLKKKITFSVPIRMSGFGVK